MKMPVVEFDPGFLFLGMQTHPQEEGTFAAGYSLQVTFVMKIFRDMSKRLTTAAKPQSVDTSLCSCSS